MLYVALGRAEALVGANVVDFLAPKIFHYALLSPLGVRANIVKHIYSLSIKK